MVKNLNLCIVKLLLLVTIVVFSANTITLAKVKGVYKISGDMVSGGDIRPYPKVSPDSSYVVYRADQDQNNVTELYSYAVKSKTLTKLNPSLSSGKVVHSFLISPDSRHVVYLADQDTEGVNELYTVPIGGGLSKKLNVSTPSLKRVIDYKIAANGSRVAYRIEDLNLLANLYTVPTEGGTSVNLSESIPVSAGFFYEISPDSTRVVFQSVMRNVMDELFSIAITGGTPTKLFTVSAARRFITRMSISNNNDFVVFEVYRILGNERETDLFSTPINTSNPVKLNKNINVEDISIINPLITADSSTVIFLQKSINAIYKVPVEGGDLVKLATPQDIETKIFNSTIKITADSQYLIYWTRKISSNPHSEIQALFKVKLNSMEPPELIKQLEVNRYFNRVTLSQDGSHLAYSTRASLHRKQLYSVNIETSYLTLLSDVIYDGGVNAIRITHDSNNVLYLGDQNKNNVYELFLVPFKGSNSVKLNDKLVRGGDIEYDGFEVSPDGEFVIYSADQDLLHQIELYIATTDVKPTAEMCFPANNNLNTTTIICF